MKKKIIIRILCLLALGVTGYFSWYHLVYLPSPDGQLSQAIEKVNNMMQWTIHHDYDDYRTPYYVEYDRDIPSIVEAIETAVYLETIYQKSGVFLTVHCDSIFHQIWQYDTPNLQARMNELRCWKVDFNGVTPCEAQVAIREEEARMGRILRDKFQEMAGANPVHYGWHMPYPQ